MNAKNLSARKCLRNMVDGDEWLASQEHFLLTVANRMYVSTTDPVKAMRTAKQALLDIFDVDVEKTTPIDDWLETNQ